MADHDFDLIYELHGKAQFQVVIEFKGGKRPRWIYPDWTLSQLSEEFNVTPIGYAVVTKPGRVTQVVVLGDSAVWSAGATLIVLHELAPEVVTGALGVAAEAWTKMMIHYERKIGRHGSMINNTEWRRLKNTFGDKVGRAEEFIQRLEAKHTERDDITNKILLDSKGNPIINWNRVRGDIGSIMLTQ